MEQTVFRLKSQDSFIAAAQIQWNNIKEFIISFLKEQMPKFHTHMLLLIFLVSTLQQIQI